MASGFSPGGKGFGEAGDISFDQWEHAMPEAPPAYSPTWKQGPDMATNGIGDGDSSEPMSPGEDGKKLVTTNYPVFKGLLKPRKLRDEVFTALMAIYGILMFAVLIYGVAQGDVTKLTQGKSQCTDQVVNLAKDYVKPGLDKISKKQNDEGFFLTITSALQYGYPYLIYSGLITIVLSGIMILLLRYFAKAFVWTVVIGVAGISVAVTVGMWIGFVKLNSNIMLILAIVCSLFTFAVYSVIYAMRSRIAMVVRIMKEAGKAIQATPLLLLQPLLTSALQLSSLALGVYLLLLIETVTAIDEISTFCELKPFAKAGRALNIIGLFWMQLFLLGCQKFVVSSVVSRWFFTRDKTSLRKPIAESYRNLAMYSIGSVGLASFIVALIRILRAMIKLFKKMSYKKNSQNCCMKCCCYILKLLERCLTYVDKLVGVLTDNAYIFMGLYGYNFLSSAKRATSLIIKNAMNLVCINALGDLVLVLAKLVVVSIATAVCVLLVLGNKEFADQQYRMAAIMTTEIGICYLISSAFIGMFETAIDAIFVCFCIDRDEHDGVTVPYFMSTKMEKFLRTSAARDVGTACFGK